MKLDRLKFYQAIFGYLCENMDIKKAHIQANIIVENIIDMVDKINLSISNPKTDPSLLSKKFHTLKNLLLYGDFYYESDLCQDIEIELKKSRKISNIHSLYNELIDSLKM